MKSLSYNDDNLKNDLTNKGFGHGFSNIHGKNNFEFFIDKYNETIDLINQLKRILRDEEQNYDKYVHCSDIESNIFWGGYICLNDVAKGIFKTHPKYILPLIEALKQLKEAITCVLNKSNGEGLGKLSEIFEDIEECMKNNNFYDFFFLSMEAKELIDDLGFNYFEVQELKRRMHKKLNQYQNTIVQYYPGVVNLWELVRHNLAMEDAAEEFANAHESLADATWESAKQQEQLVEATKIQAVSIAGILGLTYESFTREENIESLVQHQLNINTEGITKSLSRIADSQDKLVDIGIANVAATAVVAAGVAFTAAELNTIKKLQIANTAISAYDALQLRKIKKKLLGEI